MFYRHIGYGNFGASDEPIVLQVFRRCGAVKGLVAGYNNNYSDIFTLGVKRILVVTNDLQMKLILGT